MPFQIGAIGMTVVIVGEHNVLENDISRIVHFYGTCTRRTVISCLPEMVIGVHRHADFAPPNPNPVHHRLAG